MFEDNPDVKDKFYDFRDYTIEDLKKPEQQLGQFLFLTTSHKETKRKKAATFKSSPTFFAEFELDCPNLLLELLPF